MSDGARRVASVLEAFRGKDVARMTVDEVVAVYATVAVADGPGPGVSEETYVLGRALRFLQGQKDARQPNARRKRVRALFEEARERMRGRPDAGAWLVSHGPFPLYDGKWQEGETLEGRELPVPCLCGAKIAYGIDPADGRPNALIHPLPRCDDFDRLPPDALLALCRKKAGVKAPWDGKPS